VSLNDVEFSRDDIGKIVAKLPNNSAPGPDGVSSEILKGAAKGLLDPLWLLFRKTLDMRQPLEEIYSAAITPLFKGGNKPNGRIIDQ